MMRFKGRKTLTGAALLGVITLGTGIFAPALSPLIPQMYALACSAQVVECEESAE